MGATSYREVAQSSYDEWVNPSDTPRLGMQANPGDWRVVEKARIGEEAPRSDRGGWSADGAPPYRVRRLDTGHEALVFPGPDAHVLTQNESDAARERAAGRAARVQQEIAFQRRPS